MRKREKKLEAHNTAIHVCCSGPRVSTPDDGEADKRGREGSKGGRRETSAKAEGGDQKKKKRGK